jgi:hypothetical protein
MDRKILDKETILKHKEEIQRNFEMPIFTKIDVHIVNAFYESFIYIEFKKPYPKTYLEVLVRWFQSKFEFYNDCNINPCGYLDINSFERYFSPPIRIRTTSSTDINILQDYLKYVLGLFEFEKDGFWTYEKKEKTTARGDVLGYYYNNEYISKEFPTNFLNAILNADSYDTIICENSELMLLIHNGDDLALFYHAGSQ